MPNVNWVTENSESNVLIPTCVAPQCAADFIDSIIKNGVYQINSIRNSGGKLLDLIFTNDFVNVEVSSPLPYSTVDGQYHPPILLTYEWHVKNKDDDQFLTRNFYKADFIAMNIFFAEIDFSQRFSNESLNKNIDIFHEILSFAIENYVSLQTERRQSKCPWRNKQLQSLRNKKNKEWKKSKKNGDNSNYILALDEYSKLNAVLYNDYVNKMSSSLKSNILTFWRFVNTKKNCDSAPKILYFGGKKLLIKLSKLNYSQHFSKIISPISQLNLKLTIKIKCKFGSI